MNNDLFKRLQNGETPEALAEEFTKALNEATAKLSKNDAYETALDEAAASILALFSVSPINSYIEDPDEVFHEIKNLLREVTSEKIVNAIKFLLN